MHIGRILSALFNSNAVLMPNNSVNDQFEGSGHRGGRVKFEGCGRLNNGLPKISMS